MTVTAKTSKPVSYSSIGRGPILLGLAAGLFFLALTIRYIQAEKFFYFWDSFAYHRATLESLAALEQPDTAWLKHLRLSMQSGFSQMFTITIAPLMVMFGEGRVVFISGIVGFYLLPYAVCATLLINRMTPLQRWQWPMAFIACATLPVLWRASLSGYPDIGGMALALIAFLMVASDLGYKRWTTAIAMGVLLAGIFLFRRHLVYSIIPLMTATSVLSIFHCLLEEKSRRWRWALGAVLRIGCTTALTIFLIWLVAPNYFRELISNNFRDLYLPYQVPVQTALSTHWNYIGLFYWVGGGLGLLWGLFHGGRTRWICCFLLVYLIISCCIWFFYLRYLSVQYNLHFGFVISVGIGLLGALLHAHSRSWIPSVILTCLLMGLWLDRLCFVRVVPSALNWALPAQLPPLQTADYEEIKSLIVFLHERAHTLKYETLVAASSQTINSDMLKIGERALYGSDQSRLSIMNGSHVDTVQPYPLRDMIAADLILVATPFQHHLAKGDQGVVEAITETFLSDSAFARDFRRIDTDFSLRSGVRLELHERINPTSYSTQVDTARHVFNIVGVSDAWNGPFMIGDAATGAEYYDMRLIIPQSNGRYTLDLTQVRLRPGQTSITLFVRTSGDRVRHIRGDIGGMGVGVIAELYSDLDPTTPMWQSQDSWPDNSDIDLPFQSVEQGILALTLEPKIETALGAPLGFRIGNLRISEN